MKGGGVANFLYILFIEILQLIVLHASALEPVVRKLDSRIIFDFSTVVKRSNKTTDLELTYKKRIPI